MNNTKSLVVSNISSLKTDYIKSDFLVIYGDVSDGDSRFLRDCMGEGTQNTFHIKAPGINLFTKWKCQTEVGEWIGEVEKSIPYLVCASTIQRTKHSEVEVVKLVIARYEKTSSSYSSRNKEHTSLLVLKKPDFLVTIPNTPEWNKLPEVDPYYDIHSDYGDGDVQKPIYSVFALNGIKNYKVDQQEGLGCAKIIF